MIANGMFISISLGLFKLFYKHLIAKGKAPLINLIIKEVI